MKSNTKNALIVLLIILASFLLLGCTTPSNSNCGEVYFVEENLNKTIPDKEAAYAELIKLVIPLDKDSEAYKDYYNSSLSDVVYKQITLTINDKYAIAYVLKGWNAIDANGQVYSRALCQ